MRPYLLLLGLLLACKAEPSSTAPTTRTCLAEVQYRFANVDTFWTDGVVPVQGGPLCIEFSGNTALVTNQEVITAPLLTSYGETVWWYLWPAGTRAVAEVFRREGRLYLSATSGDIYWLGLGGMVITEPSPSVLQMDFVDEDEEFHATWRP